MSETLWFQVLLAQGERRKTTWVPTYGITVGAEVTLKPDEDGRWVVIEVYGDTVLPERMLKHHQQMNRKSLASIEPMAPTKNVGKL